ncbi:hypothetical protein SESBI_20740 [Sesbania bispinosa]|nr:hypothetical protein SESBI_20740 [Sesbania bispinosa]
MHSHGIGKILTALDLGHKAQIGWPFVSGEDQILKLKHAKSKTEAEPAGSYGVSPVHDNNSLTSLTGDRHNQSLPAGASQRFGRVAFIEVHPLWWMNPTLSSANAVESFGSGGRVNFLGKILGGVWESAKRKKKMVMNEKVEGVSRVKLEFSLKLSILKGDRENKKEYCVIRQVSLNENGQDSTEGERTFLHSKIGLEPESQSFEFNDNDQNSAGYKLTNQKVKEYDNGVSIYLKKNERGLDPSPYVMESVDCMTTPKHDFINSMIDSKNDYEAQVIDLVDPLSHSSKDIESFMKFPNDKESVKKSHTSPISNPVEEIDSFENSVDVYMDKTVTECEAELVVCYKESNYHVVKDICVDEGVLPKHKVMFESNIDEKAYSFFPSESFENKEKLKDNTGINELNLPATVESDQVSANHDQPKDLKHKTEGVTENLIGKVNKEVVLPEDKVFLHELGKQDSAPSDDKGEQVSVEPELHSQSEDSNNMVEEAVLASPALVLTVGESNSASVVLENRSITYQFDPSAPADCGKKECQQAGSCKCNETQHTSKLVELQSDDQTITSQVRHSLGESSFSAVVGPVSSRISYSGPVPYSGSISLRSDSSTTSTRSFAFPVLQSEWNSSPVRMAKADRRHYRKHRGWRQSLLCCRF